MKKQNIVLYIIIFLNALLLGYWGVGIYIQQAPKVEAKQIHIATINAAKIKEASKAFQNFEKNVLTQSNTLRETVIQKETEFRKEYERLESKIKSAKNKETAEKLKKDFQKRVNQFEQKLQHDKEILTTQINDGRIELEKKLAKIIEKIAKHHHFNIVLNSFVDQKKLVMFADSSFDITDLVIKELDSVK